MPHATRHHHFHGDTRVVFFVALVRVTADSANRGELKLGSCGHQIFDAKILGGSVTGAQSEKTLAVDERVSGDKQLGRLCCVENINIYPFRLVEIRDYAAASTGEGPKVFINSNF